MLEYRTDTIENKIVGLFIRGQGHNLLSLVIYFIFYGSTSTENSKMVNPSSVYSVLECRTDNLL